MRKKGRRIRRKRRRNTGWETEEETEEKEKRRRRRHKKDEYMDNLSFQYKPTFISASLLKSMFNWQNLYYFPEHRPYEISTNEGQ
jgi:hypothetical protein